VGGVAVLYRFGEFQIDDTLYELRRSGELVELQPKVFDLLLYLIRERRRVVSRDELLKQVWADVVVNEEVLTRAVYAARTALGDAGANQRIIQTVRRRGLRFVAEVEEAAAPEAPRAETHAPPSRPPLGQSIFIGRTLILAELERALGEALGGHGRMVLLGGEPGVGKTSTTKELACTAAGRGASVLSGWCYEGEGAPPYWPWIQILHAALEGPEAVVLREELGAGASDILQIVPEVRERLPDLPEPPRLPPEEIRFRLFQSITTFLQNRAAQTPLLVVLDDLQWADSASLRLLEFMAREMAASPILVLGAYRDDELGAGDALTGTLAELARHALCERLVLGGLSREEVSELLASVTDTQPSLALIEAVTERTGGNPFAIKEIASLLRSEGRLAELARSDAMQLRLPPTVKEMIRRRLSRLSSESRSLLRVAALVGQEFDTRILERVSPESAGSVLEWLEEAVEATLVTEPPTAPGRYQFAHALIRETLYEELSLSRRVALHGSVGAALEGLYGEALEPHLSELAHHFFQAVAGGGDPSKALHYALLASERADRLFAWREVISHTGRALSLLDSLPDRKERVREEIAVLMCRWRSLIATAGYASDELGDVVRRATALPEDLWDIDTKVMTRLGLLAFHQVRAEYQKSEELLELAAAEAEPATDPDVAVAVSFLRGMLLLMRGEFSKGREVLERGNELYDREGPHRFADIIGQDPGVSDLSNLGMALAALGYPDQARQKSDEAIRLAEKIGHPFTLAYALTFGLIVRQVLQDPGEVKAMADVLFTFTTERGIALFRAVARLLGGWARVVLGEAGEGIAALEQGAADLAATDTKYGATFFLGVTADAYGKSGRPQEGLALLAAAEEERRRTGEAIFAAGLQRLRGELLLQSSAENESDAESCFEQALETARLQGAKLFELRAAASLARLWQNQRKKAKARKLVSGVYEQFSEGFDTPDLKQARALIDSLS
jgi:DNA-binding winged helix-turn-helix (wHTH) protein/predicted ATPase